jgi:sulfatase maturation enzyme AslB (radical SAM superfamily)
MAYYQYQKGKNIINPCKECLVTTMCREGCDELTKYLQDNLDQQYSFILGGTYRVIANHIRIGKMFLYDNDTKWGLHKYES